MKTQKCNLLIVEDDNEELERFERAVSDANKITGVPFCFEVLIARNTEEAFENLANHRVDCAIIDLRVPASNEQESDAKAGNELLRYSLNEHAIPHALHSGHVGELAEDIEPYVKVFEKEGGEYPEIFEWLYQKPGLINAMISIRRNLMSETALLFKKSILPRWEHTAEFKEGDDELHKILLRQIVSHLAELLTLPLYDAPKHHLHEVYFCPSLREDRLHTGDLVRHEGQVHIIVTPQCNMVREYPSHFLLAICKDLAPEMAEIREQLRGGADKQKRGRRHLSDYATQQIAVSNHYLPPCGDEGPWVIDFREIISVSNSDEEILLENRFASLTPQFIPNMIQRLSAYMGRHGQPDLNTNELERHLQER